MELLNLKVAFPTDGGDDVVMTEAILITVLVKEVEVTDSEGYIIKSTRAYGLIRLGRRNTLSILPISNKMVSVVGYD